MSAPHKINPKNFSSETLYQVAILKLNISNELNTLVEILLTCGGYEKSRAIYNILNIAATIDLVLPEDSLVEKIKAANPSFVINSHRVDYERGDALKENFINVAHALHSYSNRFDGETKSRMSHAADEINHAAADVLVMAGLSTAVLEYYESRAKA